jgi:thiosulfate dehydrogenase [quinone] large subunit
MQRKAPMMTDNAHTTEVAVDTKDVAQLMARAFTALRIFTGLVWISNALAKIFDVGLYDWGFFSFNLITLGAARGIATDASAKTYIAPLGALYRDFVLPNWGFFGPFLMTAELAIGLGLLFGVATRLAALGGLLLLTPIWVMLWDRNQYLWTYPAEDLFPLLLLAIVPAGRVLGFDKHLARRFRARWPF